MQKKKVVILGGGLAGLSAATALSQSEEFEITVIERAPMAGGCTSSWRDHRDADKSEIQYPMHMIFPTLYVNFLHLLKFIALTRHVNLAANLTPKFDRFFFFNENNRKSSLALSPLTKKLPAPLHGLKILWDFDGCGFFDKISTLRFFLFCLRQGGKDIPPASDQYNFYGFCKKLGMTEEAVKAMARITYSITNLPPSEQVGPKFAKLFYEVILSHSDALGYQMINDDYTPGLIAPWVIFLKNSGVRFMFEHEVAGICHNGKCKVSGITATNHNEGLRGEGLRFICTNCGLRFHNVTAKIHCPKCGLILGYIPPPHPSPKFLEADYVVSCLQPHQLAEIILADEHHPLRQFDYFRKLGKYKGASLTISRMWLDKKYTFEDNLTGLDRHYFSFNGIMDISNIMPRYAEQSVFDTLSDDGDALKMWSTETLKQKLIKDMRRVFPETLSAAVTKHLLAHIWPRVLYHKAAPEISSLYRPKSQQSSVDNLVLAGDWISTLEIGMEGAVRSGLDAANILLRKEGQPVWPIFRPERGLLPGWLENTRT
ncbi:MAG: hypothetical protein A2746_01805 [Candidatus Yanofskybacteria bacterium RIFCSPHIGHO2_01_FULL_44_22]|uniref:Amine oxidase domain-containing protein n=1 Tax=Candidatus Yanofskybacteria bacterium RIFCSPHIGHO2_01_FULL_44_22 TaxID=1802669 RepID=A0A1F8EWP3_9BACT|nr:MAG: hypothetical protein A2746_01805 [Candidatus Yanofskybacteria bacterium RIFCSPHIGHO2_01_FULL_44_22]